MIKYTYFLVASVVLLTASSCEKEIAYKGEALDNFLVLNTQLTADSLISCRLSRSNTIFENRPVMRIRDAEVQLYLDDDLLEVLPYSHEGYYASARSKAIVGKTYRFKVSCPGYPDLSAQTRVLSPVKAYCSTKINNKGYRINCTLTLHDTPGEDYYRLRVMAYDETWDPWTGKPVFEWINLYYDSEDPVLNDNKVVDKDSDFSDSPENIYSVFNDDLFDGETYKLKFNVVNQPDIFIDVQHISKDLYLYYKSVQTMDYYGEDPFFEPVQIHCNVDGGAGICGSATSYVLPLNQKQQNRK